MSNPQSPDKNTQPIRRNVRLLGYDYSNYGEYFITICAHEKRCLFGKIVDGKMVLNWRGEIVRREWLKTAEMRCEIELGEFVIMPNHFHAIVHIREVDRDDELRRGDRRSPVAIRELQINNVSNREQNGNREQHGRSPIAPTLQTSVINTLKPKSLGFLVSGFKSAVTKQISTPIWQRGYYEHIVRDEDDYLRIVQYVRDNPMKWELDLLHPNNL